MGRNFKRFHFWPVNQDKFVGNYPIVCRSTWEFKFCKWCDENPNVLKWTSETVVIPYISPVDLKYHKYFVDNAVLYREKDGNTKRYLFEIKPAAQTRPPDNNNKRKKESTLLYENATWAVNSAKWEAATKWASMRGFEFKILTENDLFNS